MMMCLISDFQEKKSWGFSPSTESITRKYIFKVQSDALFLHSTSFKGIHWTSPPLYPAYSTSFMQQSSKYPLYDVMHSPLMQASKWHKLSEAIDILVQSITKYKELLLQQPKNEEVHGSLLQ